jgi:hypothetical protein
VDGTEKSACSQKVERMDNLCCENHEVPLIPSGTPTLIIQMYIEKKFIPSKTEVVPEYQSLGPYNEMIL